MNFFELYESVPQVPKLHLRWDGDTSTFKSWLMTEVSRDIVRDLEQWTADNSEELPFQSIFGKHETRKIIHFSVNPLTLSILDKIKQAGLSLDLTSGSVSNGKRTVRLGKFILNKTSPFTEREKDWWNHAGQAVAELDAARQAAGHAVIVSRNPIDIVRMSDHDGWSSCHAPSREYFQCAIADAKGAGAVAYVVKKDELGKVDLQAPEIFKDNRRRVDGVSPVSRVRLRKFVHKKDGYDLAVPEGRVYGVKFPGLTDTVRDWALKSQQDKLQGHRARMKDFHLMGGSYQDTQGGDLFNNLFGDDLDQGDADYGGEDEYQSMADQMETEINQIEAEFRNKFTICSFYASVEMTDGAPYVSYDGNVTLEIPEELMLPQPPPEEGENWAQSTGYKNREAIRDWAKNNDIYSVNDIGINGNTVNIRIYDEDGNLDPDSFRSFLESTLTDIDKKHEELRASLYYLFVELGLATKNKVKEISDNWDDHPHQFQNFQWEGEEPSVQISIKTPIPFAAVPKTTAGFQHEYDYWQNQFAQSVMKALNTWADQNFANQKQQPYLFQEPEFQHSKRPFTSEFKIKPTIEIKPAKNSWQRVGEPGVPLAMYLALDFEPFAQDAHVEDAIDFITFLDQNYPKFVSLVTGIFNQWINNWGKAQLQPTPVPLPQSPTTQPPPPEPTP